MSSASAGASPASSRAGPPPPPPPPWRSAAGSWHTAHQNALQPWSQVGSGAPGEVPSRCKSAVSRTTSRSSRLMVGVAPAHSYSLLHYRIEGRILGLGVWDGGVAQKLRAISAAAGASSSAAFDRERRLWQGLHRRQQLRMLGPQRLGHPLRLPPSCEYLMRNATNARQSSSGAKQKRSRRQ